MSTCEPGRRLSPGTRSVSTLILDFPWTWYCFSHQVYDHFIKQSRPKQLANFNIDRNDPVERPPLMIQEREAVIVGVFGNVENHGSHGITGGMALCWDQWHFIQCSSKKNDKKRCEMKNFTDESIACFFKLITYEARRLAVFFPYVARKKIELIWNSCCTKLNEKARIVLKNSPGLGNFNWS